MEKNHLVLLGSLPQPTGKTQMAHSDNTCPRLTHRPQSGRCNEESKVGFTILVLVNHNLLASNIFRDDPCT